MRWFTVGCVLPLALAASVAVAEEPRKQPLRVLYVGNASTPRGQAYAAFLPKHFRTAQAAERKGFDPRQAAAFDVVLLDWSQEERPGKAMSPLGPLASWDRPTVLLGSAGLLLSEAWEIHGGIG
jgi:hypothetical protein